MITVLGAALMKLTPVPGGGSLQALPGGGALNTAVHAARLGYPTALMARLSRDSLGELLRHHASKHGVDLTAAPEADEPTMIAVTGGAADTLYASNTGSLYYHGTATWQWTAAELRWIPAGTTVLDVDSLACCVAPGSARVMRAAARQRSRGATICLNLNVEPAVLGTAARARLLLAKPLRLADVVRARVDDIAWLHPGRSLEAVAQEWLSAGPSLVVITGESGVIVGIQDSGAALHRSADRALTRSGGLDAAFTAALLGELHDLSALSTGVSQLSTRDLAMMLDLAAETACSSEHARYPLTQLSYGRAVINGSLTAPGLRCR